MQKIVMILGIMASGKTTYAEKYINQGYVHLNRDKIGGRTSDLVPLLRQGLADGKSVVLDNTHPTIENRKQFIEVAKNFNIPISCKYINCDIKDATYNVCLRMMQRYGKILSPEEIKVSNDPNILPPTVLFSYVKNFQPPSLEEGFSFVKEIKFIHKQEPHLNSDLAGRALILDFDGSLRECIGGNGKFPVSEEQIEIKPNCREALLAFKEQGYQLLGVSNQSGVSKGTLTNDKAIELFNHTNKLLGIEIDYKFCPHPSGPIGCYCRKPQVGFGVEFIFKYKLIPSYCIFVGDQKTDQTFAERCGFKYVDQKEFFEKEIWRSLLNNEK